METTAHLSFFLRLIACLTILTGIPNAVPEEEPTVTTTIGQGTLKGLVGTSRGGIPFYKFMGIPYGEVKHRFADSVLAGKWEGIRDATDFGDPCLQKMMGGDETCLFINVYTPFLSTDAKATRKFPVLFFIHGGAFVLGSSNIYGADYFMDEDCVLVTINYRLGVFGFFNLGIDEAPGNQGLKDQVLALKWVQENIHHFNGDKDKVTIFGESAGAGSVSYLLLTPLTKGLFHHAISQSGAAHPECPWAYNPDGVAHAHALAAELKCTGTDKEIVDCMGKLDGHDVLDGYPGALIPKKFGEAHGILTSMSFIPSLESRPSTDKSSILLPKPALQIFQEGSFQNVPWMTGVNVIEGFLFQNKVPMTMTTQEELKSFWDKAGPQIISVEGRKDKAEIAEKVRQFYFPDMKDLRGNITNLSSDRMFNSCTKMAAELHARKSPTYLYIFDKPGGFSLMTFMMHGPPPPRPTHADELTFQFKFNADFLSGAGDIEKGHELFSFSKDFVKMWVHFAETGTPRTEWNSKKVNWEPFNPNQPGRWFHLDTDSKMQLEDPDFQSRLKFWRDLNLYA